ncbi:MAG TPA: fumarylacetoacetate hydrolase family protein [Polyangiaceae bacterium]|nr:fumarylacetoacetate hydrolase family protein [Polyangiaceae bacterium]
MTSTSPPLRPSRPEIREGACLRIARVPIEGLDLTALLFEGAFYRVDVLDELLGTPFSSELGVTAEFHRRVFGLGSAGLEPHLEALAEGHRADEARVELGPRRPLLPPLGRSPTLLEAPVDGPTPLAARVDGRALLGHEASGLVPDDVGPLRVRAALALVLGDDLHKPRPEEAAKAVLGVCPALTWAALDDERRALEAGLGPGPGRDVGTHLGPFLTYRQAFEFGLELDLRLVSGSSSARYKRVRVERERYGAILARAARYGDLTAGDALLLTVGPGLEVAAAQEARLEAGPLGTLSGRLGGLPGRR